MIDIGNIQTEKRNPKTYNIDRLNTAEMLKLINDEDKLVAESIEKVLPNIALAVDCIYEKLKNGGRLVYCGAGTSGRLGILDAVECPPTFGVDYNVVVGLMAGGDSAFIKAKEGAEDCEELGREDLINIDFNEKDVLVGIAASGRTPYVIGAMKYALEIKTAVISLSCMPNSEISKYSQIDIAPNPGPEILTGSTRMKSGTAQKMILNMLSTASMIKLGKSYGNLMVDVKASNKKLIERSKHIVCTATDVSLEEAESILSKCDFSAKHAIVMILSNVDYEKAKILLDSNDGKIYKVLESLK